MRRVFTRDHIIWSLTFAGSVLAFVVTSLPTTWAR